MKARLFLPAAAAALLLAPAAEAKIWFLSVRGDTYVVGSTVTTEIAGCPTPCGVAGTRIALGRTVGYHAAVRPLTRVLAVVDEQGALRFRVPRVQPGRYRLVARFMGRWLMASDTFRVRSGTG